MTSLVSVTVFFSSFLLFMVQPMIAKYLLPLFGGGSSVWVVAVFVFQSLLFLGYLYAERLMAVPLKAQRRIHAMVTVATFSVQLLISSAWLTPIFAPESWIGGVSRIPEIAIIVAIVLGVGAFYFLLSTTTVLVQSWYHRSSGKSPYWLYRNSNVASILAIAAYPFLIEPFLALKIQSWAWFISFTAYLVFLFGTIASIKNDGGSDLNKKHGDTRQRILLAQPPSRSPTLYFLLLSFSPSFLRR